MRSHHDDAKATYCEPAVLWRLRRGARGAARAVVVPTWSCATLVLWIGDQVVYAEDFPSPAEAVAAAERARPALLSEGWTEAP